MSAADDMMRDKHGQPPAVRQRPTVNPVNLLPIRAAAHAVKTSGPLSPGAAAEFAQYAADVLPQLCDEIVRLRAAVSDMQVTPA